MSSLVGANTHGGGLIARILRNRKQRCLFGPHLTTAWSGRGNGDLRVVSCACEWITEIRDKDNSVLCVRWARIDVPGVPPWLSPRKYLSIIRYYTPFSPQPNTSSSLRTGRYAWSEGAGKGWRETSLLAYSLLRSPESPGMCGRFLISLFDSFFLFDNLTGCLRCRVASIFFQFLGRWLPGLLGSLLFAIQILIAIGVSHLVYNTS